MYHPEPNSVVFRVPARHSSAPTHTGRPPCRPRHPSAPQRRCRGRSANPGQISADNAPARRWTLTAAAPGRQRHHMSTRPECAAQSPRVHTHEAPNPPPPPLTVGPPRRRRLAGQFQFSHIGLPSYAAQRGAHSPALLAGCRRPPLFD